MDFINPIEILQLHNVDISTIDSSVIKKAKRQLFAEIDLFDEEYLLFGKQHITKSDIDRVVRELDDQEKKEFYHNIANDSPLNEFLKIGDPSLFDNFSQKDIYEKQAFTDFISPFFCEKYKEVLLKEFKKDDSALLEKILSAQILLKGQEYQDLAFSGVYNEINSKIKELNKIVGATKSKKEIEGASTSDEQFNQIKDNFKFTTINLLPQYFQSLRKQVAQSIRNYSVEVFNSTGNSQLSLDIIDYALTFTIDENKKNEFLKDRNQINKINEEQKRETKDGIALAKYVTIALSLRNLMGQIERNETTSSQVKKWLADNVQASQFQDSNPELFELRDNLAIGLKALSISAWNTLNDIDLAISINLTAVAIAVGLQIKSDLVNDSQKLLTLTNEVNKRKNEMAENEHLISENVTLITSMKNIIEKIEQRSITTQLVEDWFNTNINISQLKALNSEHFIVRDAIAASLRSMSVSVWNKFYDANLAKTIISAAKKIVISPSLKSDIVRDEKQLDKILGTSVTLVEKLGCLSFIGVAIIMAIIYFTRSTESSPPQSDITPYIDNGTRNYKNDNDNNTKFEPNRDNTASGNSSTNPVNTMPQNENKASPQPQIVESPYKGNQLQTGASPLSNCFGSGAYSGNAWIKFINSNISDAIVCLISVGSEMVVRNGYIRAGETFRMSSIPAGTYYIKVCYGNDWNPTKTNFCGTQGAFDSNVRYSKSDNQSDWIEVSNNGLSYTTGTITLYTVEGGNMSTNPSTESDFFGK